MSNPPTSTKGTALHGVLANKRIVAYCVFACIAAFPTGFDTTMLVSLPPYQRSFGYEYHGEYVISAAYQSIWNAMLLPGGILGAALAGPIGGLLGRRYVFIVGSVIFAAAILQLQVSRDWKIIMIAKFFYYGGMAMYAVGATTYISEIAPPEIRGVMLSLFNVSILTWLFLCSCVLQSTQTMLSSMSFLIPIILQYSIPIILFTCSWFIPESPYWLVAHGKTEAAKESLEKLHGRNHDLNQRLRDIEHTINQQRKAKDVTYLDCFKGSNLRRTLIATGILAGQQIVGCSFVFSYTPTILILAGISQTQAFAYTALVSALGIIANIASWFLIERFGRRFLLLTGTTVMLVSHCIIGGIGTSSTYKIGSLPKVIVSFIVIYSVFFQISVGSAGWAVASEVSSPAMRALTQSIALVSFNVSCFAIFFTIPYLINLDQANLGPKVFLIYGAFTLITLIFIYFAVPEMKGRTYEELDYMFQHRIPTRKFGEFTLPTAGVGSSNGNKKSPDIEEVDQ